MDEIVNDVVNRLIKRNETISTMEACTGGAIVNAITNVQGSSKVIKFSAITYSHDYKVRLGVDKNIIEEYSVYSLHTVREMAFRISFFAESTYGIGITGKFDVKPSDIPGKKSPRNKVFISIYNSKNNTYTDFILKCPNKRREKCKEYIVKKIMEKLIEILNDEETR